MTIQEKEKKTFYFLILIYLIIVLPFCNNYFLSDDLVHLAWHKNSFLEIFTNCFQGKFYKNYQDYNYRPLANILLVFLTKTNSSIFGHLFMYILHLINGIILLKTIRKLGNSDKSVYIFGIFLFHPAINHNVFWLASISDMLATFFSLLAFYYFIAKEDKTFLVSLLYFLAILNKEIAYTLPGLLFIYSLLTKRLKSDFKLFITLTLVALLALALRSLALDSFLAGSNNSLYFNIGLNTLKAISKFILELSLPIPFHILYQYPVLLSLLLLSSYFFFSIISHKNYVKDFLILSIVSLVAFLPILNVYMSWYLYFPLCSLLILLSYRIKNADNKLLSLVIFFFILSTFNSALNFKDAGLFVKNFLMNAKNENIKKLEYIGTPYAIKNWIPVIQTGRQVEDGLKHLFSVKKEVNLLAQTILDKPDIELIKLKENKRTYFKLPAKKMNYFYLSSTDFKRFDVEKEENFLGSTFITEIKANQ